MSTFAERLVERMEPWNTGPVIAGSTDLERWLKALAAMFEPVEELAKEEGFDGEAGYVPAWGKLFDPELCPAKFLPYLGQYVGVQIPGGASEAEARQLVKDHAGFSRGTLASVEAAVRRVAGEPFSVVERTGPLGEPNAYYVLVFVGAGKKTNALYEAINAVKPSGVFFTVTEVKNAWINVAPGKKWSEATALEKWSEAKEGAP